MRLDGYIRVSQTRGRTGESFISPGIQRDRIEAWCRAYGHDLAAVHEELDQSGAKRDRPLLQLALSRVEAGLTDGIIVAKLDRFGRSLIDGLGLIGRIQDAGGTFISVADGFDLTTDTGRLVLQIMLSLAEFELARVRTGWHDAKAAAVMRGIHPSAWPPFGYRRHGKSGRLLINDGEAQAVRRLFEMRAGGAGWNQLARWLRDTGQQTRHGRQFSPRAVKDIIRNDVYMGVASAGSTRNPDAHEAVVTGVVWERAQTEPGVQFKVKGDVPLISGLVRCAGCRYIMRTEHDRVKAGPIVRYSCKQGRGADSWSWECTAQARIIDDGGLTGHIVRCYLDELPDLEAAARRASPELDEADRGVDEARRNFEQWRDDQRIQARLGMDAYLDGLQNRQGVLNEALGEQARCRGLVDSWAIPASAGDLRAEWPGLPVDEQRALLRSAVKCVMVKHGSRDLPVAERVTVVWRGEDVVLPRTGYRAYVPLPFGDGDAV